MPERKVLQSVTIARGSKETKNSKGGSIFRPAERHDLKPGDVFDFTEKEIQDIEKRSPGALSTTVETDIETGEVKGKKVESGEKASADGKPASSASVKAATSKGKGKDDGL